MASPISVSILEVTRVRPPAGSPNSVSSFSLPFTLFDTFWLKLPPAEPVFFYRLTELTPSFFNSVITPKLKHSLSLTLLHYLPLAGSIIWPSVSHKPFVLYSPTDGVSFTAAESSGDFNTLSGAGPKTAVDLHPLVPRLHAARDKAEILSLQITLFPNKGFSIGLQNHSTVYDGISFALFMKSWAYICRKTGNHLEEQSFPLPEELTPCFDRSLIKDPTGLNSLYLNQWIELNKSGMSEQNISFEIFQRHGTVPSDMVRATFELTPQNITTLREKILTILNKTEGQLHLSTFVVLLAHAGTCWIRCKQVHNRKSTVSLGSVVDFRARLDPPLPENYFGRCTGWRGTIEKARDFMDEKGLGFAAERISHLVKRVKQGVVDEQGAIEVSSLSLAELFGTDFRELSHVVAVAGSCRLDLYGLDYGWGRPVGIDFVHIDRDGAISVIGTGHGGGVVVGVALNRREMETFSSLFVQGLEG